MPQLSDKTGNGLFKQKNCPYFVKSSSLPARKGYEGLASVVRMRATMLQSQIIPNKKRFMLKSQGKRIIVVGEHKAGIFRFVSKVSACCQLSDSSF